MLDRVTHRKDLRDELITSTVEPAAVHELDGGRAATAQGPWIVPASVRSVVVGDRARIEAGDTFAAAVDCGTTALIDHHESPNAINGSLSVIADACAEVGVRVSTCYGITDRHGPDGARRGLEENVRAAN